MVVWLASYPRSGNTYFRIVAQKVFGIGTSELYGESALTDELKSNVGLEHVAAAEGEGPVLLKTHELPGEDSYPSIYLVRDGRDTIVSFAHYIHRYVNSEVSFEDALGLLAAGTVAGLGFPPEINWGGWGQHVMAWLDRANVVLRFEELVSEPIEAVRKALQEVGMDASTGAGAPTFEELHSAMPEFFRRGETGGWKDEMPAWMHEIFWARHGQAMEALGYQR